MFDLGLRSVLDQFGERLRAAGSRLALAGGLLLTAAVAALGGLGFLVAMLYMYLATAISPLAAGLLTGGLLLVVAAFLLFLASRNLRGPAPSRRTAPQPLDSSANAAPNDLAAQMGASLGADAVDWARKNPAAGIGAALAAGFVVGANPGLVRELSDHLKPRR